MCSASKESLGVIGGRRTVVFESYWEMLVTASKSAPEKTLPSLANDCCTLTETVRLLVISNAISEHAGSRNYSHGHNVSV